MKTNTEIVLKSLFLGIPVELPYNNEMKFIYKIIDNQLCYKVCMFDNNLKCYDEDWVIAEYITLNDFIQMCNNLSNEDVARCSMNNTINSDVFYKV